MPRISRSEHYRREVSRVEGFSDAVFAFAITLLVVSLEVPKTFEELTAAIRAFPAFAVCFAMLFQVWWRHYRFFRSYDLEDGPVIAMTGLLLFVVLFYVYPLKFLWSMFFAQFDPRLVRGDAIRVDQFGTLFEIYGLGVAAVFGILGLMYGHAYRRRDDLELTPIEVVDTRVDVYRNFAIGGIGLLSVVVAAILSRVAPRQIGLAGYMYFLIGIAEWQLGTYGGRLRKRVSTTNTSPV
jgi:Endosomal/lysosomal potassium channel TMEM175